MLDRIEARNVLGDVGRKQPVARPYDEMRGVGGIDDVDGVDAAAVLLTDALEHPLGPGAFDAASDAGIFHLERAGDLLRDGEIDRGVPGELAFLLRGGDQLGRNHSGRRGRRHHPRPGGAEGERRRADQNLPPGEFFASHRVSRSLFWLLVELDAAGAEIKPRDPAAIGTGLLTPALACRRRRRR